MQYLNNTQTGEVIKVTKTKDIGIYYEIYENTYCRDNSLFPILKVTDKRDNTIIPNEPLNENDLIEYTSNLKVLEIETSFGLNNDIQNWCVQKGSTGLDTTLRVIIPNSLIIKSLNTGSPLDLLLKGIEPLKDFLKKSNNFSVQYLEELYLESRAILEMYPEIIIENKII